MRAKKILYALVGAVATFGFYSYASADSPDTNFMVEICRRGTTRFYDTVTRVDGLQQPLPGGNPSAHLQGKVTLVDFPNGGGHLPDPAFPTWHFGFAGSPGDLYLWAQSGDERDVVIQFYDWTQVDSSFTYCPDTKVKFIGCRPCNWEVVIAGANKTRSSITTQGAAAQTFGYRRPSGIADLLNGLGSDDVNLDFGLQDQLTLSFENIVVIPGN